MLEDDVTKTCLIHFQTKYQGRLFRNNVGACLDKTGRLIRYGLCNTSAQQSAKLKSSDYVGFVVIDGVAVFLAIEFKKEDWKYTGTEREKAQLAFIDLVKSRGGKAGFANSIECIDRIIKND